MRPRPAVRAHQRFELNLFSYYLYIVGAGVVLVSIVGGGIDTGWTFYPPYSSSSPTAVPMALVDVFIVGFSTILTGLNFIVTTHTMRAKGMTWMKMPLFVWSIYATSIIQVLATPVLGMVLVVVVVGAAALPVAIAIAAMKALLVVVFFMELARETLSIKLTLLAAGALGVLLGSLMIADIVTRDPPAAFVPGAPRLPMH